MASASYINKSAATGILQSSLSPKYLHTNSTSHTWPFSAIAELIDNAYDPDVKASQLWIDEIKIRDKICLTFTDNGNGMPPDKLHKMLSFGYCEKVADGNHMPVGHYGNGFKSGSMRLGKDALVLTKQKNMRSIGYLSQTYLEMIKAETVVVPIATWDRKDDDYVLCPRGVNALNDILQYSLLKSVEKVISEFDEIHGDHGTRIIISNIRTTIDRKPEFDFETDEYDIRIPDDSDSASGKYKRTKRQNHVPECDYSLRAYCAILYLKPKMQIILREKKVKTLVVAKSLSQTEVDKYKPTHFATADPVKVVFGFNSRNKNHYGIMMYHRNRLIKPYERVGYQFKANNLGVGVVGVVECNFLQPTHNKQDFDYTKAYRACIYALGIKLNEYWNEKKGPAKSQSNNFVEQQIPEPEEVHALPDQNWVQCDRPSCLKWRKIPDGINPDSLPDKWYCENNPDPNFKSCDVPEEKDEETEVITPYHKAQKKRLVKEMEERQKREKAAKLAAQREQEEKRKQLEKKEEALKEKEELLRKQMAQLQNTKPNIKVEGGSLPTAQVAPRPTAKPLNAVTPTAKSSSTQISSPSKLNQLAACRTQVSQSTPITMQTNQSASTPAKPPPSPVLSIPLARSNQSTPSPTLSSQSAPRSFLLNSQSKSNTNTTNQSPSNKQAIQLTKTPTKTNFTFIKRKPTNDPVQTIKLVTPSQAQKLGTAGITFKMVKAANGSTYLVPEERPQGNVANTGIKPGATVIRASGSAVAAMAALGSQSTPGTSSTQTKTTSIKPAGTSSSSSTVDIKPRLNVLPNPQISTRSSTDARSTNNRSQNVVVTTAAAKQQNVLQTPSATKTVTRSSSKAHVQPSHSMAATAYSEITGNTSTTPQDVKNILTSGIKREHPESLVSPIAAKVQRKKSDTTVIVIDPLPSETRQQKQRDLAAENRVKELEKRVKELENQAKEHENRAREHENRAKEHENRAKELESLLTEAKSDAKDKMSKMAMQLDQRSTQLSKRNKEIEEKTKEIHSKENELKDKMRQLKMLRGNIYKLLQVLVPEIDVESEGDEDNVDDLLRQVLEANT